jgi:hypothetical protein
MRFTRLFLFILFTIPSLCQAQTMSAPIQTPTEEKAVLLDEMILATKYESSFYSKNIISIRFYGDTNHWDESRIQQIMRSVHFSDFKSVFCSHFSDLTIEELKDITMVFKKLNKTKRDGFIITSNFLEGELDFYIRTVISGAYLKK